MFSWNYQDQVADLLWGDNKGIEDHIVPVPKEHEGNSFSKHEKCSKKQKKEENNTSESSKMGSFESENNFFISTMENNYDINKNQDLNDAGMDMDAWAELSNLSMAFCGGYNDGIHRDSFQSGLESKLAGASVLKSVGVGMAGYNHPSGLLLDKGSSLSKPYIHLIGNGMQLDAGLECFGYGDEGNDGFMDYDWSNIEDLDDLDMLLRNDELIQNANAFLASSTDVISSTSQYIPVPEFALCRDHQLDKGSAHQLAEHTIINHSQNQKTADATLQTEQQTTSHTCLSSESCGKQCLTFYMQNLTPVALKKEEKPKDDEACKDLHNSRTNKNQQMTRCTKQHSAANPPHIIQAQSIEQLGSSHQLMIAECGYPAYQYPGMLLPQQIHGSRNNLVPGSFNTNPDYSKLAKPVEPPPKQITMTPREKIEKLRWRQQKQAMLAIQQQREQYNHQNSAAEHTSLHPCWQTAHTQDFTKSTIAMEEYDQKLPSSESSLLEQIDFPTISSLIDDCVVKENIYYHLKFAMEKLNMAVRLSIRDSLYRLARSSKERQNAINSNSTHKSNMDEETISAYEESHQHDRCSRMHNLEAATNPIDRVVAHLLFHNPSGSSLLHSADGNMSTTTST